MITNEHIKNLDNISNLILTDILDSITNYIKDEPIEFVNFLSENPEITSYIFGDNIVEKVDAWDTISYSYEKLENSYHDNSYPDNDDHVALDNCINPYDNIADEQEFYF